MSSIRKLVSSMILLLSLVISICSVAEISAVEALSFPDITETNCVWDRDGNLIRETTKDLDGKPALNARGFYRAEYTWDGSGNCHG